MRHARAFGSVRVALAMVSAASLLAPGSGCTKARERAQVTQPANLSIGPSALRGTIGQEATLRRATPVRVSGYGLVVDLDGNGSTEVPDSVAATMEREILTMAGGHLAFDGSPFEGLSPRQILRHPDTAVVIVEGLVAPGAPQHMRFDVLVRALSGSSATSLEGGKLWTTRLQIGPPITLGGPQTEIIAEARGEIFVNPFVDPDDPRVDRRVGRVLGGGVMTDPQPLELILENPLHSRAVAITRAINQRFPNGPRGEGSTARGRDDQVVQIYTPPSYRDRFEDFVLLLLATPVNQSFPEQLARRYTRALVEEPDLAEELSWALRAIGPQARGFVRDLYDFPERSPRLAALTVGAHLNDERAAVFLERMAIDGPKDDRLIAIDLLGEVEGGPSTDEVLQQIAGFSEDLTERSAAYESLMKRAERWRLARLSAAERARSGAAPGPTDNQLREAARLRIPPGNPQGVERISVGGRFLLDLLPFGEPMVYVTQQGEAKIAIFGARAELNPPLLVDAWSNRLLIAAEDRREGIRLRYQEPDNGRVVTQTVSPRLADLVVFMARGASAVDYGPGLGFSFSQVVGALAAIEEDGATDAAFATEQDRLRALLLASASDTVVERPALIGGEAQEIELDALAPRPDAPSATESPEGPVYVVPVPRKSDSSD